MLFFSNFNQSYWFHMLFYVLGNNNFLFSQKIQSFLSLSCFGFSVCFVVF